MAGDDQPTDELDAENGGRAPAALADPPLIAAGRRLGGRYVLDRRLGHGGMAVVWLALDERLDREVAVKVLSDTLTAEHDYRGRFRQEAHVAAGLQHPNLVSVYDYDAGERPYLVMEYIEGGDLSAALEAGTAPPADQLTRELLSALNHIHGAGILHRDIKPQNVLVDGHGHSRLTDFGIARPLDATSMTKTGHVIGTERYLAPEVMRGEPATVRSDLYALGVLLAALGSEGELAALADRLRDPDPELRPASASAALAELGRIPGPAGTATQPYAMETEPQGPRPFEPTIVGPRSRQRRNRFIALAAVGLAVAAAAVALLAGGGDEGGGSGQTSAQRDKPEQSGNGSGGAAESAPAETTEEPATTEEPSTTEEPAEDTGGAAAPATDDGFALNDQGFALLGEGNYEEAVPILEQAVDALSTSADEQTYNYALYNLATAYMGVDRAADAIPLLQERMRYDDGQLAEVQKTLDEAYKATGEKPPKEEKAPKPEKPGKGPPTGQVPPGHVDD